MSSLSLEISLIVIATVVNLAAVLVGMASLRRRTVAAMLVVVLLANGASLGLQVWKVRQAHAHEAAVLARKGQLVTVLGDEIQAATSIEYRLESLMTRHAMTQVALAEFIKEIECWRTRVGDRLSKMLPGTQAAEVFQAARGDFPGALVVVGAGASGKPLRPPVHLSMTPGFYNTPTFGRAGGP